jgi:8-oxo-dGTP pyrophosphatase MutT (NUDIX family)
MTSLTLMDRIASGSSRRASKKQYGAVPYQMIEGRCAFLLITSRRTGRWIFPKGSLIEGLTPQETAAQEAFEEAGVEGHVHPEPIGSYRTVKQLLRRTIINVEVFPLRVERQLDEWPEIGQRYRHWVMLKEAKRLLSDRGAVAMAEAVDKLVTA